jgi:hypothetical protein
MVTLVLCGTMNAQHQAVKDTALARSLDAYLFATQRQDFSYIVDHVHPTLLASTPKAALIESMQKAFNYPEAPMSLDTVLIERVKGPVVQNAITYHYIRYEIHMRMYSAPDKDENGSFVDAAEQASKDDLLMTMLQLAYGKDEVHFAPETRDYLMRAKNSMFAMRDYIPYQVFVDEHWREMKNPNREVNLSGSYDSGYHFGYIQALLEHLAVQ